MREEHPETPNRAADDASRSRAALRAKLARQLDDPAPAPFQPPPIPDHTLLCRIGEGACGEVWLARNALGILRAVKIVYRARFRDDRPYDREFDGILKYEPISRTHEGLVQVLHVGRKDEVPCFYYVMELADDVPGPDLDETTFPLDPEPAAHSVAYRPRTLRSELASHQRLPPALAAQLALRLAKALTHLHDHGLVHRDIKPSNVIFVSGQPKLADIGLVTDVGSSHSFVGTEGFIPPEGPGTPQADLYAVGKLLYELATGRDRMDFPQLPPRVHQLPDGEALLELNEVVTRACAPDPATRYTNATELQAELNLFLSGRSLRRARNIEKYVARFKKLAVAACALLALTVAALWFSIREERHAIERAQAAGERALTEAALRRRAEAAERASQRQLHTALLEQARATVRSGDLGHRVRALEAIRQAGAISNSVELRREMLAALALPDLRFERELSTPSDATVRSLDPKLERIAIGRGRGAVEIRAVPDNRLLASLPASADLRTFNAAWCGDGRFLAVKRDYDTEPYRHDLEVWDVANTRQILLVRDGRWNARSFHPHKAQLLTGRADGSIVVWDLEEGKELTSIQFEVTPENLVYSPDGNHVAATYRRPDGWALSVHNAADGSLVVSQVLSNLISAVEWHPGGLWVAVTTYGGDVHLLDAKSGALRTLGRHKAEAATVVFSPEGDYLLTGGWERELICWDMRTLQRAMTIALDSYVGQFRSDGRACALLTLNGVQLHSFEHPTAHRRFAEELGPRLRHAAFSPDGRWLAASADRQVGIWDLARNTPAAVGEAGSETQLFWSPDGFELFGSSRSETCYRWRVEPTNNSSAPPRLQPMELPRPKGFISFHLNSDRIVWTGDKGALMTGLTNIRTDDERWAHTIQGITSVSPDGRWLAICRGYGTVVHVYGLPEMLPVAKLTNQASIAGFSFSPSQDELAVASRGQVEFWSTATWDRTRTATNFIGMPDIGVLFSPNGRTVWLAKDFRTAGLYDTRTLELIVPLPTGMIPLALSADGHQLALSVDAQRLQVWDILTVRQRLRELGLDWAER